MRSVAAIAKRELVAYFATPVAYVFIIIFLAVSAALTFYVGGFFERRQAALDTFFTFHPWLFLFLIPAVGMRLWAEERKTGTIELLTTMPVTTTAAVIHCPRRRFHAQPTPRTPRAMSPHPTSHWNIDGA